MKRTHEKRKEAGDDRWRIVVVDDHPIICEALAQKIHGEADMKVCGQARDAHAALEAIKSETPDLVIVDIALNGTNGIDLIKDLKIRYPQLPTLVLTMHDETLYAEQSLHAGAKGYVMKQEQPDVLLLAIRQVLRGQVYLSQKVKDAIVNRVGGVPSEGEVPSIAEQLSDREFEVFQFVGDGYATHEIADKLHLSMKTVASHREHIKEKLKVKTGEELTRYAIHWQRLVSSKSATISQSSPSAGSSKMSISPRPTVKPRRAARSPI